MKPKVDFMLANRVHLHTTEILSDDWGVLKKIEFDFLRSDGAWQRQSREIYQRGAGAVILPYNINNRTVILIKQFRLAPFLNEHPRLLVEAPAGLLGNSTPEDRIRSEVKEETGFNVTEVEKIFEAYMIPGFVTEKLHFFVGQYERTDRVSEGGGEVDEGEDIEVMELPFEKALTMVREGEIIDGKTILLIQHLGINIFSKK